MARPKCLKVIDISQELIRAVDRFELVNNGTVDALAATFVKELIELVRWKMEDSDNFYYNSDKASAILTDFYEEGTHSALTAAYEDIEERLHTVMLDDEIDGLLVAVIRSAVDTFERQAKRFEIEDNLKRWRILQRKEARKPRKKYKLAVKMLQDISPLDRTICAWYNRKEVYKRLRVLGCHYEKGSRIGYWSDIPW